MSKHRGEAHEEHMDESWLIPYADLLTLLLALFIVLYAASNVDKAKIEQIMTAFEGEIKDGKGLTYVPYFAQPPDTSGNDDVTAGEDTPEDTSKENQALQDMQALLQQYLQENGLESQVSTSIDERGLVISMNDAVLFDPGKANIKQGYSEILVRIGQTIDNIDNYIRIEGHTDTVPTNSDVYPTNWELSGARAITVLRLFQDWSHINPEKLSAVGYGEYRPVADNSTAEGRSKNRRVDIILLSSRFNALENTNDSAPEPPASPATSAH